MYDEDIDNMSNEFEDEFGPILYTNERHERLSQKNKEAIKKFMGRGPRSVEVFSPEPYYFKLLAWTVKAYAASVGWKIMSVYAYSRKEPVYLNVPTDYQQFESCLSDGQLLVENGEERFVITISGGMGYGAFIQVDGIIAHKEKVKQIIKDIGDFMRKNNFYKGKKICLDKEITFLNPGERSWGSVILDPVLKQEIYRNTVGFLKHCNQITDYHVPFKRGVILSGEPGTGKTIICKALMSVANGTTCITTTAYRMFQERYITELYALARDLSPSLVCIEDLDFVGQERIYSYRGSPPLIALLAEMDGIEDRTAIVTIATTNSVESLDKALSERPSRFDRVFLIPRPDYQRRVELLKYMAQTTPLSEEIIEYVARKTEGYTPAQLQEVPYSMVIAQFDESEKVTGFSPADADAVISQMNFKKGGAIGFSRQLP